MSPWASAAAEENGAVEEPPRREQEAASTGAVAPTPNTQAAAVAQNDSEHVAVMVGHDGPELVVGMS